MGDDNGIQKAERGDLATAAVDLGGKLLENLVVHGDTSQLSGPEKARYYIQLCESLGLNPVTRPIQFIKFQGREIPYFLRSATDQLAAIHRLNRKIVVGPEVRKSGQKEIVYCEVEARHPNGRVESDIGTMTPNDPGLDLMKCVTKAKRRVTLAILGLGGMPDESEVEDMRGAERVPLPRELMGGVTEVPPPQDPPARTATEAVQDAGDAAPAPNSDRGARWREVLGKATMRQLIVGAADVLKLGNGVGQVARDAYGKRWAELLRGLDDTTVRGIVEKQLPNVPAELRTPPTWDPVITVLTERGVIAATEPGEEG